MSTTNSLPPIAALDRAHGTLSTAAAGNVPTLRALNKALYQAHQGVQVVITSDAALLIPSGTRGGVIHRCDAMGCSCEATGACWHLALQNLVIEAQRYTMPALPKRPSYAEAKAAVDEMFI